MCTLCSKLYILSLDMDMKKNTYRAKPVKINANVAGAFKNSQEKGVYLYLVVSGTQRLCITYSSYWELSLS